MLIILQISMQADLPMLVTCFSVDSVRECYTHIFCLQGKQNISVSYVNGGWVRVWERGSVWDNEQTLCFITIQLVFVWCHPCLYIWNAILHTLDWGVYLIWLAGIVQLCVICENKTFSCCTACLHYTYLIICQIFVFSKVTLFLFVFSISYALYFAIIS